MYACTVVKYLWKDASKKRRFKILEKKLTLSFAPTVGLEVSEDKWFSGKIERIVWDNSSEIFTLKVGDLIPKEGVTAELLLDVAVKQGWDVRDE